MTEDKKCLNCSRMTVSQDEYIAGMQEKIHALEKEISVLVSCADCSENKGGYICEKEYNDKCLAQKIEHIKELNEENAKLKKQNEELVKLSQNRGIFIDWCCSKHPKIIIQYLEE